MKRAAYTMCISEEHFPNDRIRSNACRGRRGFEELLGKTGQRQRAACRASLEKAEQGRADEEEKEDEEERALDSVCRLYGALCGKQVLEQLEVEPESQKIQSVTRHRHTGG
uniref:Uncharacterized protein n=1 Tax=Knipowitschia caucasica TaxID=637954 RepID=A0AAV2JFX4_KNICA